MKKSLFIVLLAFACQPSRAQTPVINSIVNVNNLGVPGDAIPAATAKLYNPGGIAYDRNGNLYIADLADHTIRKVDLAGTITTVAGQHGMSGHTGDGGPATAATLAYPAGITIDSAGNMYISEGSYIRKVNTSGMISTIAGGGWINPLLNTDVTAVSLSLDDHSPVSVAIGTKGDIYFVALRGSAGIGCIGKIDPAGIFTRLTGGSGISYAGVGSADGDSSTKAVIINPISVVTDLAGNIYFSDAHENRIRKIDRRGKISTYAGSGSGTGASTSTGDDGPATIATLGLPCALSIDNGGNIYVRELNTFLIRRIDQVSGIITRTAGNGTMGNSGDGGSPLSAQLDNRFVYLGLAYDRKTGNLALGNDSCIRLITGLPKVTDMDTTTLAITDPGSPVLAGSYPNPVLNTLHFDHITNACKAAITDMNGKLCLQFDLAPGNNNIDTHALVPGNYQLILTDKTNGLRQISRLTKVPERQ